MALKRGRYREMISKYYRPFIAVSALSTFGFALSCYLIGINQFYGRKIYSTNSSASHSLGGKEISTNDAKCTHLREIAKDMLSNGERVDVGNYSKLIHSFKNITLCMKRRASEGIYIQYNTFIYARKCHLRGLL